MAECPLKVNVSIRLGRLGLAAGGSSSFDLASRKVQSLIHFTPLDFSLTQFVPLSQVNIFAHHDDCDITARDRICAC